MIFRSPECSTVGTEGMAGTVGIVRNDPGEKEETKVRATEDTNFRPNFGFGVKHFARKDENSPVITEEICIGV